jgi:hypothetical protein
MRRLTLQGAVCMLGLVLAALAVPARASGQEAGAVAEPAPLPGCINCTATNVNGTWKCTMSLSTVGWKTCACNPLCDCSGDCVSGAQAAMSPSGRALKSDELAELGRLPAAGGVLATAPSQAVLASLDHGRWMGRMLDNVYLGDNYGLVQRANGSWSIFPLQADGTMALRDCQGLFRGLVHRAQSGDGRTAAPLALASL